MSGSLGPHPDELDPRFRRFWSCSLGFGEAIPWNPMTPNEDLEYGLAVAQVAVAPQAQGTHVILCTVAGEDVDQTAVIATLDPQTRPQQRLKLVYSEPTMFTLVQGEGPVYLSGTEVLTNAYDEGDIDDDEGGASNELLRELADAADGREISSAAREILHNAAMGEVDRRSKSYFGSALELADLVENYKSCKGNWEFILKYQPGSTEDQLGRYKKMIRELTSKGLETFSKAERAVRRKELENLDEEIDLEGDVDDESEVEGEEDDADRDFIDDDGDSDEFTDPVAMAAIVKGKNMYAGSSQELRDLIDNYTKCAGQWDLIDRFQPGITEETLARFKKLIKDAAKKGQVQLKFSKTDKAAVREAIETQDNEEDLDESDDDEEEEDVVGESDQDFINDMSEDETNSSEGEEEADADVDGTENEDDDDEESEDDEVAAHGVLHRLIAQYQNSTEEKQELIANYERCCGNWDLIVQLQTLSNPNDLSRLKELVQGWIETGTLRKYSKEEQLAAAEEIESIMDSGMSENEGEEEESDAVEEADDITDEEEEQEHPGLVSMEAAHLASRNRAKPSSSHREGNRKGSAQHVGRSVKQDGHGSAQKAKRKGKGGKKKR
eukprot:m.442524 g.442524  ORF g.442524 m.442524 type:complete len:610 (-) comp18819_c0_seq1:6567-8396(-)